MTDHEVPDYPLDDELELDLEQIRTVLEPTRTAIIELLSERAATVTQLADALDRAKGTIGHHCKTLQDAGLIRVVRTKQVRAITAKYYGRTARTFLFARLNDADVAEDFMLAEAIGQMRLSIEAGISDDPAGFTTIRYARIPAERAAEWADRMHRLAVEFSSQPRQGERTYGMAIALFPTTKPALADEEGS